MLNMTNIITLLGITILVYYSLTRILKFYGIDESTYGYYTLFYLFMITSVIILPNSNIHET